MLYNVPAGSFFVRTTWRTMHLTPRGAFPSQATAQNGGRPAMPSPFYIARLRYNVVLIYLRSLGCGLRHSLQAVTTLKAEGICLPLSLKKTRHLPAFVNFHVSLSPTQQRAHLLSCKHLPAWLKLGGRLATTRMVTLTSMR